MGKIVVSYEQLRENSKRHKNEFYSNLSLMKKSTVATVLSAALGGAAIATGVVLGIPALAIGAGILTFFTTLTAGFVLATSIINHKFSRYREKYLEEKHEEKMERKKLREERREQRREARKAKKAMRGKATEITGKKELGLEDESDNARTTSKQSHVETPTNNLSKSDDNNMEL